MKDEFNISLKILIEKQLSFEAYFIIWCLYHKQDKQLTDYVLNCRQIPTEEFYELRDKNLINIRESDVVYEDTKKRVIFWRDLSLTEKGKTLFEIRDFDKLFSELREAYPSVVGDKHTKRRLHTDLKRCKNLYKKIIGDNIDLHNLICKCAMLYHEEKRRSGSEAYMQNLVTWLHQENYLPYMDEASRVEFRDFEKGGDNSRLDDI